MGKIFTTKQKEGRLNTMLVIGSILLALSALFIVQNLKSYESSFLTLLEVLLYPAFALALVLFALNGLRKIKGSYVSFDEEKLSYKTRKTERNFDSPEEIRNIAVKPKTIEIYVSDGSSDVIYLEDYSGSEVKKEIKHQFQGIQKQLNQDTTHIT